jgi:hypothetical protein
MDWIEQTNRGKLESPLKIELDMYPTGQRVRLIFKAAVV